MQVEIWSDVVCPWCYLGRRHLELALEWAETAATGADLP
jgi:predicted DsbA family dithiol-disulfide isomerase